ncbi:MAG TPA: hypothetical protein VM509_02920 [Planctomycetota bacterium]|nr:hypothetical protein [Planctomycetota bacterium]
MRLALALAAAASFLPAQQAKDAPEPRTTLDLAMEAHLSVVRAERELDFFERYASADPDARARARTVLERLRTPGAASGAPSTTFAIMKAMRALEGPSNPGSLAAERLMELVDALDVQMTPGMIAAGAPIQDQLVRLVVYPLYPPPERLECALSLWWTRPDGERRLGHRALAKPAVFDPQGFRVEVAAPGSEPGTWKLSIELERESLVARGAPLSIACVPRLAERSHSAFDALEDPTDPRQALARWIALASQRGLRTLAGARVEEQLARIEGEARAGSPYPWSLAFEGEGGDPHWIWRVDPEDEPRAILLALCPSSEPPEASLSRAEWALPGCCVLSSHLPRGGGHEGSVQAFFERLKSVLAREGRATLPLVCVERGDAVGRIAMGFHGASTRPFAAEILSLTSVPPSAASLEGTVPRLVFAPGGRADVGELDAAAKTWWIDAPAIPLIADFELPRRMRESLHVLIPVPPRAK